MEGGPMAKKGPEDTRADGSAGGVLARARAKVPLSREPRTLREEQQRATRQKLIAATFSAMSGWLADAAPEAPDDTLS